MIHAINILTELRSNQSDNGERYGAPTNTSAEPQLPLSEGGIEWESKSLFEPVGGRATHPIYWKRLVADVRLPP